MTLSKNQGVLATILVCAIIIIDQVIKIYVKTHFFLHESVKVTSWFYLSFIENNGMAYGMELVNKYALTSFRIVAVVAFAVVLKRLIARGVPTGFVVCCAMVIAGAFGNIVDCVFYGQWFTDSYGHVARWVNSANGLHGYQTWMQGRVVDMFFFPLVRFEWPEWVPRAGEMTEFGPMAFRWPSWAPCHDEPFIFFRPVFNFADAAISVGMAMLIICYHKTIHKLLDEGGKGDKKSKK